VECRPTHKFCVYSSGRLAYRPQTKLAHNWMSAKRCLPVCPRNRSSVGCQQLHDKTTLYSDVMSRPVTVVIDDDPSLRGSLGRLLRAKGYICETCGSAEEFLDGFATSKATCLLIDIDLGSGLSGIELCKYLKASGRSLNVIVMTGVDIQHNKKEAIKAGCNAYLHKPFSPDSLVDAIEKAA
jgi:CheY-like chemotaxis protein